MICSLPEGEGLRTLLSDLEANYQAYVNQTYYTKYGLGFQISPELAEDNVFATSGLFATSTALWTIHTGAESPPIVGVAKGYDPETGLAEVQIGGETEIEVHDE